MEAVLYLGLPAFVLQCILSQDGDHSRISLDALSREFTNILTLAQASSSPRDYFASALPNVLQNHLIGRNAALIRLVDLECLKESVWLLKNERRMKEEKQQQQAVGHEDLTLLYKQIAQTLGEVSPNLMEHCVRTCKTLGRELAVEFCDKAMKLHSEQPNKTAGGHFYKLDKQHKTRCKAKAQVEEAGGNGSVVTPRPYQLEACEQIGSGNAILALPTGLGKTLISKLVCEANRARNGPSRFTCLFVCQDRALCMQQCVSYAKTSSFSLAFVMGGEPITSWNVHAGAFESHNHEFTHENWQVVLGKFDVVFLTAGLLCNVWDQREVDLDLVSILVLDESHHAGEGTHDFVHISKTFVARAPGCQILGLTASPVSGSNQAAVLDERLEKLRANMGNAKLVVPRVPPEYLHDVQDETLELPNAADAPVINSLVSLAKQLVEDSYQYPSCVPRPGCLKNGEFGESVVEWSRTEFDLAKQREDKAAMACFFALSSIVPTLLLAETLGASCGKDLLPMCIALCALNKNADDDEAETRALVLNTFMDKVLPHIDPTRFRCARMQYLVKTLSGKTTKTLIRVKTKGAGFWLARELRANGIKAHAMVGRADMTEASSRKILEEFKRAQSEVNVIVATSTVEEGIDVSDCDLVITYGADGVLNSGKSWIQNAGRARKQGAKFVVICKNLKDLLRVDKVKSQVSVASKVLTSLQ